MKKGSNLRRRAADCFLCFCVSSLFIYFVHKFGCVDCGNIQRGCDDFLLQQNIVHLLPHFGLHHADGKRPCIDQWDRCFQRLQLKKLVKFGGKTNGGFRGFFRVSTADCHPRIVARRKRSTTSGFWAMKSSVVKITSA